MRALTECSTYVGNSAVKVPSFLSGTHSFGMSTVCENERLEDESVSHISPNEDLAPGFYIPHCCKLGLLLHVFLCQACDPRGLGEYRSSGHRRTSRPCKAGRDRDSPEACSIPVAGIPSSILLRELTCSNEFLIYRGLRLRDPGETPESITDVAAGMH